MKIIEKNGIKYIIKPEDGMVIAVLKTSYRKFWQKIESQLSWDEYDALYQLKRPHYSALEIKGVAKCAEGDVFDEEYGMKLAEAKIYSKLHNIIARDIMNVVKKLDKMRYTLLSHSFKHISKSIKIDKDLGDYFGVEFNREGDV